MDMKRFVTFKETVVKNVSKVIIGKDREIELLVVAFLAGGHVLLEDMPGMGKTMMIKAFSKTVDLPFKRIQFTPDLLPSDITGINFYNQKTGDFQFREGPLFANVVLTDEINRATPRTQSALLEAMEEKQITVDGVTHTLKTPFMVLATQNPIENYGTFPLPEAQLDRFLMRFKLGLPTLNEEKLIIRNSIKPTLDAIEAQIDSKEMQYLLDHVGDVTIHEDVLDYLVAIVNGTRYQEKIALSASPRGSIALFRAAQARAAIDGRNYVLPEDIKELAPYVLNHRLKIRGVNSIEAATEFVVDLVKTVTVPLENIV